MSKVLTQEPHLLFSFEYDAEPADNAIENSAPLNGVREGHVSTSNRLQLDLRLETCVHSKLNAASEAFASLLVFSLDAAGHEADAKRLFRLESLDIEFHREVPRRDDQIEVSRTGEVASLIADVHRGKRGVSWSAKGPAKHLRFGVLLERNFSDRFVGSFRLTLAGKLARRLGSEDDTEPVLFDPATAPVGATIDADNLEEDGYQVLRSLNLPLQVDGPATTNGVVSFVTGDEASQDPISTRASTMTPGTDGSSTQNEKATKVKSSMMFHHKQRHIHTPHLGKIRRARSPSSKDLEMQPLQPEETNEEVWSDPVRFFTSHEIGFNLCGLQVTRSGVRCIRSIKTKITQTNESGEIEEFESSGHWSLFGMLVHKKRYHDEAMKGPRDRYLVVGRISTHGYVKMEIIMRYREHDEEDMLRKLHKGVRAVRGMQGIFSLKRVSGFGLYQVRSLCTTRSPC